MTLKIRFLSAADIKVLVYDLHMRWLMGVFFDLFQLQEEHKFYTLKTCNAFSVLIVGS